MNTLKYKGYIGSVAYSEPDKVFYGTRDTIRLYVPHEDLAMAKEIAKRMGWDSNLL